MTLDIDLSYTLDLTTDIYFIDLNILFWDFLKESQSHAVIIIIIIIMEISWALCPVYPN